MNVWAERLDDLAARKAASHVMGGRDKIAKQHNTTIIELQKLNKITDPKKLQIGQQLTLPPTPASPAATEKKEGQ